MWIFQNKLKRKLEHCSICSVVGFQWLQKYDKRYYLSKNPVLVIKVFKSFKLIEHYSLTLQNPVVSHCKY